MTDMGFLSLPPEIQAEAQRWRYVRGKGLTRTPDESEVVLEPRLGCELNAHRDLGFCAACPGKSKEDELQAWRELAISERGVARQPT